MKNENVAIIGSGISGLSSAFFLSKQFNVFLFEKNDYLGGHTRTINLLEDKKKLQIDTGFIVYNEKNYPDLKYFFKELDVKTANSNMSFSISDKEKDFEYGGSNLNSLFANRRNIFSFKFIFLITQILKLYRFSKKYSEKKYLINNITIEQFLNESGFSEIVRELHIYPMISSIWSVNKEDVKNFPLLSFIEFFSNHGLFNIGDRPQWKYVKGGSNNYIKKLLDKNLFKFYTNVKIKKIIRNNKKIQLINSENKDYYFDKIIFATHADEALELLDSPSITERKLLSQFRYSKNKAFLHNDQTFMPKRKLAWSSWNFLKNFEEYKFSLTYWMNRLQNIPSSKNYFVTINPIVIPNNVLDSTTFSHPIFSIQTHKAQKELNKIQGIKNTYFCGSYCGYGFHEDGIQSAAYIAELLNITLPWQREHNFKSRLNYSQ